MWHSAAIGTLVLGALGTAQAAEASLSGGATFATEDVSNGIRYWDGPTVQPFTKPGFVGLFAGAQVTNVNENVTGANAEYGLSLGYRGETGKISTDIGIACYICDAAIADYPVEDSAGSFVSAILAVADTLDLTAMAALAPEYDQTNLSVRPDFYTAVEGLSVGVIVGAIVGQVRPNYGDWTYWSLDTAYALSAKLSPGLAYHHTNLNPELGLADTAGPFVATVSLAF